MKKIVIFDTSIGSRNLGDFIIKESIDRRMDYLFANNLILRLPTHTPLFKSKMQLVKKGPIYKFCNDADYKFIAGTNIFKETLMKPNCDWSISLGAIPLYKNSISLGCGLGKNKKGWYGPYTKFIYKRILSKNYYHSTRDEKTKQFLESLGFKAINTGCPTLWGLTPEHCQQIPSKKSKKVVFTLTDYSEDKTNDQKLIDILNKNYEKIYYWPQGTGDLEYLHSLKNAKNIEIISPNLENFRTLLNAGDIDYIGTRLHGGIYAMQHFVRTIIIIVDNRARDMKETYNLNTIERADLNSLEALINSNFETKIRLDNENIEKFKNQFK